MTRIDQVIYQYFIEVGFNTFERAQLHVNFVKVIQKMNFLTYCVFSKDFRIFRTLAFLCFPLVSVCVHTPGR